MGGSWRRRQKGGTWNQYKGKAGGCTEWFEGVDDDGRGKSSYTHCAGMSTVTADVTLNFDWLMTGARGDTNSSLCSPHVPANFQCYALII